MPAPRNLGAAVTIDGMTVRYLGAAGVARAFGVSRQAVVHWCDRNPPGSPRPFPAHDGVIAEDEDAAAGEAEPPGARLWLPGRIGEIREWRKGMPGQGAGGGRPRLGGSPPE